MNTVIPTQHRVNPHSATDIVPTSGNKPGAVIDLEPLQHKDSTGAIIASTAYPDLQLWRLPIGFDPLKFPIIARHWLGFERGGRP
jgi:hypothetical protein